MTGRSTSSRDGGPAFPASQPMMGHQGFTVAVVDGRGMSLRDWFAGQALPVILARWLDQADIQLEPEVAAYEVADRMLKAREASS